MTTAPELPTIGGQPLVLEDEGHMVLNMGPHHPSTHGVLRFVLELDGETVVRCQGVIGYLHTGFEKTYENRTYHQGVVLTDRMDYLNPLGNNLAYALAVEKLLCIQAPPRATVARVILAELQRISSHLVYLGTQALELGAMSLFFYGFREREMLLDIFEMCSGQRLMTSYIRPGGLMFDLPPGFEAAVEEVLRVFPAKFAEYDALLRTNEVWLDRMVGIGTMTADFALSMSITGPNLRASGVAYDVRKANPYCGYETYDFDIPTLTAGDCYARYLVRRAEMGQSLRIVRQALDRLPGGDFAAHDHKVSFPPRSELALSMEALIHHFKLATEGYRVPAGEVYVPVESPRGELGFFIVSDGSGTPYRARVRPPSFYNLQAINRLAEGAMVADLVAILGSLDPVAGEVDR